MKFFLNFAQENSFIKEDYTFGAWDIDNRNHYSLRLYEQEQRQVSQILRTLQISYNNGYFVFNNMEIDVIAYWLDDSKTITFDSNDGTGIMKEINVLYSTSLFTLMYFLSS